jgi:hypothetical protein
MSTLQLSNLLTKAIAMLFSSCIGGSQPNEFTARRQFQTKGKARPA